MMFKKVMGLAMVLALTACGGGGGANKGESVNKDSFDEAAAERTDVPGSGYNHATLKGTHYQKVGSRDAKQDYTVTYDRDGETWNVVSSSLPAGGDSLAKNINFTLKYYPLFVSTFEAMLDNIEFSYYLGEDVATLEIYGESSSGNLVGNVKCEVTWEAHGLITHWYEKDVWDNYYGYSNVVIEETMNFSYAA